MAAVAETREKRIKCVKKNYEKKSVRKENDKKRNNG